MKYRAQNTELPVASRTPGRSIRPGGRDFPGNNIYSCEAYEKGHETSGFDFLAKKGSRQKDQNNYYIIFKGCATVPEATDKLSEG